MTTSLLQPYTVQVCKITSFFFGNSEKRLCKLRVVPSEDKWNAALVSGLQNKTVQMERPLQT